MSKILVVDDSQTSIQFVTETFTKVGHTVKTANHIWIAPLVSEFKPDLILMDVNISKASKGTVAVEALRKLKIVQEHCIVILHSSISFKKLSDLADGCGADGFLCKTNDSKLLINYVNQLLTKKNRNNKQPMPKT